MGAVINIWEELDAVANLREDLHAIQQFFMTSLGHKVA